MFDFLDHLLISRACPADDWTIQSRRIDGTPDGRVIYFLPWNTSFRVARHAGFLPLPFLAAYEMPPAIVSSDPNASVAAVRRLVEDAAALVARHRLQGAELLVVGLSVGTYPATCLAAACRARLCAVTPADRGDLMIWQSPAARNVKARAIAKGYRLLDYARTLRGWNPVDNMQGLRHGSVFVVGARDRLVPEQRSRRLIEVGRALARGARFLTLDAGHVRTLTLSAGVQTEMFRAISGYPRPAARVA